MNKSKDKKNYGVFLRDDFVAIYSSKKKANKLANRISKSGFYGLCMVVETTNEVFENE